MSTATELERRGHSVLVETAGRMSVKPRWASELLANFTWINATSQLHRRHLQSQPQLVVCWFAYFADRGTRRNPSVVRLLRDPAIPRLLYENGMTKDSVTVDPKGFLGDSYYVDSLNWRARVVVVLPMATVVLPMATACR